MTTSAEQAPLRDESVGIRAERLLYTVDSSARSIVIASPLRFRLYGLAAAALFVLIFAFLMLGEFSRKVSVFGVLLPAAGLADIRSSEYRRVLRWHAAIGEHVSAGESLADVERRGSPDAVESLRAPFDGVLLAISHDPNLDSAPADGVLAQLAPDGPLALRVQVPAAVRERLGAGSEVLVRVQAIRGSSSRWLARIRNVSVTPTPTMGLSPGHIDGLSYEAVVQLDTEDPAWQRQLLGLPAEVELTLERRPLYAWLLDPARTLFSE